MSPVGVIAVIAAVWLIGGLIATAIAEAWFGWNNEEDALSNLFCFWYVMVPAMGLIKVCEWARARMITLLAAIKARYSTR